jgi:DNA-binding NarL/FixJ family response regulator
MAGRRHLSRGVAGGDPSALPVPAASHASPEDALTPREVEVLRLLATGLSMKAAAAALGITARTVAFHKYRMMQALGVRSTAELVRYAVRYRLV